MTIESATYISDLNASYPGASDLKSEGDDHLRLLKSTIKATFPNVAGAVTPTHTQLNYVAGVTSGIQAQLDSKISSVAGLAPLASPQLTGTVAVTLDSATSYPIVKLSNHAISGSAHTFGALLFDSYRDVSNPSYVCGVWASGSSPLGNSGDLVFGATINGSAGLPTERLRINSAGGATFTGTVTATGFSGPLSGNVSQFTNDAGYLTSAGSVAASSLTGTNLAANVVNSSLQTVGTLSALTVTAPITGSVTGSAGSVAWANVSGKPTVFSTVAVNTVYTGISDGSGSYITDVTLTSSGSAVTLNVYRTYHVSGGGGP